jgi:tellurite resistance protein TehA-like permease
VVTAPVQRIGSAVRELSPGYFALVMASAIVSTGLLLDHQALAGRVLLLVSVVTGGVLVALNVWRITSFGSFVVADFHDPRRTFGFLTFVAAVDVVATRLALGAHYRLAFGLLMVAELCWLVLGYAVLWAVFLGRKGGPVLSRVDGSWFLWAVSTESVAVTAAALAPHAGWAGLRFVAVIAWSVGVCLYGVTVVFVGLRAALFDLRPEDLDPSYWVSMGGASICVLACSAVLDMPSTPILRDMRGLVAGVAVLLWAFATWLIPALVAAGWWRHVTHRVRLEYDALLWSMVFPLGMYAVASMQLGRADHVHLLRRIGSVELWVALAAFVGVFAAMLVHLARTIFGGDSR